MYLKFKVIIDPDPRGKISTKNCQKKVTLKTQI